jgi:hypothetical protein
MRPAVLGLNHVTGIHHREMVARGGIEPPTRGFSVASWIAQGYVFQ